MVTDALFGERLEAAVERCGSPVVVGIDPHLHLFPAPLRHLASSLNRDVAAAAVQRLCDEILEAVGDVVGVIKPQVAFFERLGPPGWAALERLVRRARNEGLLVIADAKRGDIGSTAEAYADYFLGAGDGLPGLDVDALTLSPYLGPESLEPFARHLARGKGFFLLAKTSNPGSERLQELRVEGPWGNAPVYMRVAALAAELGSRIETGGGRSPVGIVVGAAAACQARALREAFPSLPFLVPGYGAQKATAEDVVAAFDLDGRGAVVNASRSILFAYRHERYRDLGEGRWAEASRRECCAMRDAILAALQKKGAPARGSAT